MSLNILFGFFSESNRLKISSVVKKKDINVEVLESNTEVIKVLLLRTFIII